MTFSNEAKKRQVKVTTLIKNKALEPHRSGHSDALRLQLLELMDWVEESMEDGTQLDINGVLKKLEFMQKLIV